MTATMSEKFFKVGWLTMRMLGGYFHNSSRGLKAVLMA